MYPELWQSWYVVLQCPHPWPCIRDSSGAGPGPGTQRIISFPDSVPVRQRNSRTLQEACGPSKPPAMGRQNSVGSAPKCWKAQVLQSQSPGNPKALGPSTNVSLYPMSPLLVFGQTSQFLTYEDFPLLFSRNALKNAFNNTILTYFNISLCPEWKGDFLPIQFVNV